MRRVGDITVAGIDAEKAMRMAIEATQSSYPHPNPRVGAALIASSGEVVSTASHQEAGLPHAEVLAIEGISDMTDLTLVVTLEPCNHLGRTGPCTDAIIRAGIRRVIVGATDPDARVAGAGIARLRSAGIEVIDNVLADEVRENDPAYFHHRSTGRPFVTLKLAATLDGQVAALDGTSQWISSPEARHDAHLLRSENDVVIVGAGTVLADDPRLTVRIDGYAGPQPRPVVIVGVRELPADRAVLASDPIIYRPTSGNTVDPVSVVADLGERGYVSALVEGGPAVARSFLDSGLVDRVVWYAAARLAGGTGLAAIGGPFETLDDIHELAIEGVSHVGPDLRIVAVPRGPQQTQPEIKE